MFLEMRLECNGSIRGTISYNPLVRFFARLKRVDLVTDLDGAVVRDSTAACVNLPADSIHGTAMVERTELRGAVRVAGDSVRFIGPTWTVGDSSYHSLLHVTRADSAFDIRINLYERHGSSRARAR